MTAESVVDFEQDSSTELSQPMPFAEETPAPISDTDADEMAFVAAITMNTPENYQELRDEFKMKGRSREYENALVRFKAHKGDEQARKAIIDRLKGRAEELGMEFTQVPETMSIYESETMVREALDQAIESGNSNAIVDAFVQAQLDSPNPYQNMSPAEKQQWINFIERSEDAAEEHNKEAAEIDKIRSEWGRQMLRDGIIDMDWSETAKGVGGALLPITYGASHVKVAELMGIDTSKWDYIAVGSLINKVQDHLATLSPEERIEKYRAVIEWAKNEENHPWYFSDIMMYFVNSSMLSEEFLKDGVKQSQFWKVLENVFGAIDAAAVGMFAGSKLRKFIKPALRTTDKVNKSALSDSIKEALYNKAGPLKEIPEEQLVISQLPKVNGPGMWSEVDNIPDALMPIREEAEGLSKEVAATVNRIRQNVYEDVDVESLYNAVMRHANEAAGPALRTSMSSFRTAADKLGVDVRTVYGEYGGKVGFPSLDDAIDYALDVDHTGETLRILKTNPRTGSAEVFMEGASTKAAMSRAGIEGTEKSAEAARLGKLRDEIEGLHTKINSGTLDEETLFFAKERLDILDKELEAVHAGIKSKGEFYIEQTVKHEFHPTNQFLFGEDNPVLHGGLVGRYLGTPTAQFSEKFRGGYQKAFGYENNLIGELNSFYAPITKLSTRSKRKVNAMANYASDVGEKESRHLSYDEIVEKFHPDEKEIEAYYRLREFNEHLFDLQNVRLYTDRKGQGFVTAKMTAAPNGAKYSGKPLQAGDAKKAKLYYDPSSQKGIKLTASDIDDLYERGGSIIDTDMPIDIDRVSRVTYVVVDPDKGWRNGPLSLHQLKYEHGYFPRILNHPFIVRMNKKNMTVNGVATEELRHTSIVARTADSLKEANKVAERINNKLRASGRDDITVSVQNTANFGAKELSSVDSEMMKTHGRLFFEDRAKMRPKTIDGAPSDVVAPLEMLFRSTNAVARQVSTDELIRTMHEGFKQRYSSLIPNFRDDLLKDFSAVQTQLKEAAKRAETNIAQRKLAKEAMAYWDYVGLMEGMVSGPAVSFRRAAIHAGEALDKAVGAKPGMKALHRGLSEFSPVETAKRIAFFDFLTTRPMRQLILQGGQHMFLAPLAPGYAASGKWFRQASLLLNSHARKHLKKVAPKEYKAVLERNAKLASLSKKEYELLVDNFNKSGLPEQVAVHTFGAGTRRSSGQLKDTALAAVGRTINKPFDVMRKYGFDLGEKFNVTASYMLAARVLMKERKYKSFTQLTAKEWRLIDQKGIEYALAMNRANSAKWQYGFLSLPLQFLSFTHKIMLSMLRGVPGLSKWGNKTFTPAQARRLIAGQLIMFGGYGFGLKPEFEQFLVGAGFEKYVGTETIDDISGGLVDWLLDKSLSTITGNDDVDLAWGAFLAPGANVINVARDFIDAGFENPPYETLAGPVGATASRFKLHYELAQEAVRSVEMDTDEKLERALEFVAGGFMSGASDYTKARLMAATGRRVSMYTGKIADVESSWEEIILKGMMGINAEDYAESFQTTKRLKKDEKALDQTVEWQYNRMKTFAASAYAKGIRDPQYLADFLNSLQIAISGHSEDEKRYMYEALVAKYKADRDQPNSFAENIQKFIMRGVGVDEYLEYIVNTSKQISESDRPGLVKMLNQIQKEVYTDKGRTDKNIQHEIETWQDDSNNQKK